MAEKTYPWKLAWITGASGAICGEVAKRLAAAGVTVAATARHADKLQALASANGKIKAYPADVLKPDKSSWSLRTVSPKVTLSAETMEESKATVRW